MFVLPHFARQSMDKNQIYLLVSRPNIYDIIIMLTIIIIWLVIKLLSISHLIDAWTIPTCMDSKYAVGMLGMVRGSLYI